MSISEVFGEFRCGKTQLSHTMSVVAQLPKSLGGADGKVAYIDTEGTFRPERIAQIAERFGVDPDAAQENIAYARALNSEHQLELLNTLSREFAGGDYRLLVIDSIMNCFRVDYCGRGELAERQQKLNQFLMKLAHMAEGMTLFWTSASWVLFWKLRLLLRTWFHADQCLFLRIQRLCPDGKQDPVSRDAVSVSKWSRQTKSKVTPALVHSLLELMVASLSVDMCLLMRPRLGCFFAKAAATSVSPRYRTRLVSRQSFIRRFRRLLSHVADCPELEATYVITNGGISDPDKV